MGKLLWTLLAASVGFVAAVAGTPADEVERAYAQGFAEGAKSLQSEAVRRGYGAWENVDVAGAPASFRWAEPTSRWRAPREASDHHRSGDQPSRSAQRNRQDHRRSNRDWG